MEEKRRAWMRGPDDGELLDVAGDRYRLLARRDETDAAYALIEAVVPPGGGPPAHTHSREEEGFYLLQGELTFYSDGERFVAGPGAFVHLPKGTTHRFQNESAQPARMLILLAPGGLEAMFGEVGTAATAADSPVAAFGPTEIQTMLAAAPRYGVSILPPPIA